MPSHKLRWGILGTASIAEKLIPAMRRSQRGELVAIASRDAAKAAAWAVRYGIPRAFASYEALLDSGEIDLLYLPLPNSLHATWTRRALEAGLHVLCEKPLTLNAAEARELAALAREKGRVLVEAFMYRHHPVYGRVLSLIREGVIGRPITLHSHFSFLLDDPSSVVASRELGGGALLDIGCYGVNFSRLVAGGEPLRSKAVAAIDGVDRSFLGLLEFPGGLLATFSASIAAAERHRAEVHGETASLVLESPWHPGVPEAVIRLERHGQAAQLIRVAGENPYLLEVEDLERACLGEATPRWPVEDAVANMAVLDALRETLG